jgi:hypothetical protein
MAKGDHGCRWLVTPVENAVIAVLAVLTRHGQGCGACSQGSRVELCVCYLVRLKIKLRLCIYRLGCEVGYERLFDDGRHYTPEMFTVSQWRRWV